MASVRIRDVIQVRERCDGGWRAWSEVEICCKVLQDVERCCKMLQRTSPQGCSATPCFALVSPLRAFGATSRNVEEFRDERGGMLEMTMVVLI
eukprot:scaffold4871_cov260-Pinguiococcus_pyrenoidosus.AAC.5